MSETDVVMQYEEVNEDLINSMINRDDFIKFFLTRNKVFLYFNKIITITKRYGKKKIGFKQTQDIVNNIKKLYETYYCNRITCQYIANNFSKFVVIISMVSENPKFVPEIHYKDIVDKSIELSYMNNAEDTETFLDYCSKLLGVEFKENDVNEYLSKLQEAKKIKEQKPVNFNKIARKLKTMLKDKRFKDMFENFGGEDVGNISALGD